MPMANMSVPLDVLSRDQRVHLVVRTVQQTNRR
jgi:hypothetical protein